MKRKFFFKIFIFIFLGSLFSILFFTSLIYLKTKEDSYDLAYQQAHNIQNEFGLQLNTLLSNYSEDAKDLAESQEILDYIQKQETASIDAIYNLVYSTLAKEEFRAEITILNQEHHIVAATNTQTAKQYLSSSDDWGIFREMKDKGSVGEVLTYVPQSSPNASSSVALSLGLPMYQNENLIGYIMIDFPHTTFSEVYRSSSVPYNIDLVLSDAQHFSFYDSRNVFQENTFLPEIMQSGYNDMPQNKQEKRTDSELFLSQSLPHFGLLIFAVVPFESFESLSRDLLQSLWLIIVFLLIASGIFSFFLAYWLYRPIDAIIKNMSRVEKGDLDVVFQVSDNNEMSTIADRFNSMMKTIRFLMKTNEEKQLALRAAEIKALQSQMRPHFLYNVLNSIKFMAKLNGVNDIADMVTHLGVLLRSNIATEKEVETVSESINLINSYLKIQSYRYEDQLDYQIYVDPDARDCTIPRLIIQPLVENAIEHGIEEINEKGFIFLSIVRNAETLFITVEDNGKGIDPTIVQSLHTKEAINKSTRGNGIGLRNIFERLGHYYGENFRMNLISTNGTSVFIEIPCEELRN